MGALRPAVRALTENALTDERVEQLLEVGRAIVSELDPEIVLRRVLDAARDLTGAKYAALGILNEDKTGLERFLHSGHRRSDPASDRASPEGPRRAGRADPGSAALATAGRWSASSFVWVSAQRIRR